jgi:hypothetical protein
VVSMLATGPKVRGFDPRPMDFLRVIKIRSTTSFGGEVKPSVPCRRFTACKRPLRVISHPSLLTACQMALAVTSGSIEQHRGQLASHQLPRMRTTQ